MPRKLEINAGERYGRWVIQYEVEKQGKQRRFVCTCDCGKEKAIQLNTLLSGATKSCGCLKREKATKHGECNAPLYKVWAKMKERCLNPNHEHFQNYGGRGIEICPEWHEYNNFKKDMGKNYKQCLQLDRKDNDGPYNPENCRWVTATKNSRNKRNNRILTFNNKNLCLAEWSEVTGISKDTIRSRLESGWSTEKALTTAPRRSKK